MDFCKKKKQVVKNLLNKKKKIIEECDTTFDKTKWLDNKKLTKLDKQRISLFRKAIHGQHPAIEKELVAQYKKTIEQGLVPTSKWLQNKMKELVWETKKIEFKSTGHWFNQFRKRFKTDLSLLKI